MRCFALTSKVAGLASFLFGKRKAESPPSAIPLLGRTDFSAAILYLYHYHLDQQ